MRLARGADYGQKVSRDNSAHAASVHTIYRAGTKLKPIGPIVDKQPVRRQLDGYSCTKKRSIRTGPDLIFIGQCEATLVWGPETGADCNFEIPDQITGL